jgi:hypothetical protein
VSISLGRIRASLIIGYSFSDLHITQAIEEGAARGNLAIFIIDPLGVDVVNRTRDRPIRTPTPLDPYLIGASRRNLREIFGHDVVEHGKVMRFFA